MGTGHARFYVCIGGEQFRKEVDGSFTNLDFVMFDPFLPRARTRGSVDSA